MVLFVLVWCPVNFVDVDFFIADPIQGEEERDHHQSKTSARARGPHRTTDAGDANNPLGRSSLSTSKCIDYHADKPIVRTPRPQDYDVKVAGNHVNEIHDFRKQLNFLG